MTKHSLRIRFSLVIGVYVMAVLTGITIRLIDTTDNNLAYSTFKDMIPLVIAVPAVYLTHSLQRRSSYLQQLRTLWSKLVEAIQGAHIYLGLEKPTEQEYATVMMNLRIAIDEIRGVFMNKGETPATGGGAYPFEPLRQIYRTIEKAGYSKPLPENRRREVQDEIFRFWKVVRIVLLREFDREEPTFYYSQYAPERGVLKDWPPRDKSSTSGHNQQTSAQEK